jgi:hypothetical protein
MPRAAFLPLEGALGTHSTGDWVGLRFVLDAFDKNRQDGDDSVTHTHFHRPQLMML